MNKFILYHGTTSISAINILKSGGIKSRNETKSKNQIIETTTKQMNVVYLTKNKTSAISYGYDRTDNRGWTYKDNQLVIPVVFNVNIDDSSDTLLVDEDYLVDDISNSEWTNFLLKNKIINDKSESRNWSYFYEKQPEIALKILRLFPWQNSLKTSESIVFEGSIGLNKIHSIELYYDTINHITVNDISLDTFYRAYRECCKIIINKYMNKYNNEIEDTKSLPNPFKYELLNLDNNKLDGTIYKNINLDTLNEINELCKKYKYPLFNKIIITSFGKYFMQPNTYIKYVKDINNLLDVNKYLILDIEDERCISISYFTYIRNSIGLIIRNKNFIKEMSKNKPIIFEMKYHDIKFFKTFNQFFNFVNQVEQKEIIVPAKKEIE